MRRVMDDIRQATAVKSATTNGAASDGVNGKGAVNGESAGVSAGLAVPQAVVDEALRVTRESLEMVCEIEENGAT